MNSNQCRMARAALKWSLDDLSEASSVGRATIQRFEAGKDTYTSTATKLQAALESSGKITFNGDNCVCVGEKEKFSR